MKKILYITALVLGTAFVSSCEREDDSNFTQPNYLAGKWIPVEVGTVNAQNIMNYMPYENDAECDMDFMVLNEDMTFSFSDFEYNGATCETNVLEGDYKRESKTLILTTIEEIDGVPTEVETTRNLVSLTYDSLEISYTDESTGKITFLKFEKQTP